MRAGDDDYLHPILRLTSSKPHSSFCSRQKRINSEIFIFFLSEYPEPWQSQQQTNSATKGTGSSVLGKGLDMAPEPPHFLQGNLISNSQSLICMSCLCEEEILLEVVHENDLRREISHIFCQLFQEVLEIPVVGVQVLFQIFSCAAQDLGI